MKSKIAAGTTHLGEYSYQNMNFGLCRILIATLNGNVSPGATWSLPFLANGNDVVWDYVTIEAYRKYVRDNVFAPAGVVGPTLAHGSRRARIRLPASPTAGTRATCRRERRRRLAHVGGRAARRDERIGRNGTIMTPAHAQQMLDNGFGIDVKHGTRSARSTTRTAAGRAAAGASRRSPTSCRRTWSSWC